MTNLADKFGRKLKRAMIINLNTGDEVEFLINPTEMNIGISAKYSRLNSVGFPGKHQQYVGNENANIEMTVVFDDVIFNRRTAFSFKTITGGTTTTPNQAIVGSTTAPIAGDSRTGSDIWANRLQQFIYPRMSRSLLGGSPPATQFIWPGVVSMRVLVLQISYSYKMFYHDTSGTRILTAGLAMEEVPVRKLFSKNAKAHGFIRPGASGIGVSNNGGR